MNLQEVKEHLVRLSDDQRVSDFVCEQPVLVGALMAMVATSALQEIERLEKELEELKDEFAEYVNGEDW